MKLPRRTFLKFAAAAVAAPAFSRLAAAQTYPSRSITMIVPFPPGGTVDVVGRILAERMKGTLGQPIIIENVSGANGSIGTGRVARAAPDGYTIDLGWVGTHVFNAALYSLPYDALNDFEPIAPLHTNPAVLFARKTMPAKDLNGLIAWLKANHDKASVAIVASGAVVLAMLFQKETGTHFALAPYRGATPAIQDLVAGHVDLCFETFLQLPLVRGGNIKAYAVTSDTRVAVAPDIPTFAEMGLPTVSLSGWRGLFAPRGTSRDIVSKLNAAAVEALADPAVRSRLAEFGFDVFPRERQTPQALGTMVKADAEKWWPIIKEFGIKAE
jgi:tripartite-type tricarboxylate transporter receptor subunit TctC